MPNPPAAQTGALLESPGISPRETGFERLDFEQMFGNRNPVVLEVGSGKGRFLVRSAQARPAQNFIGIEKSLHYYRVITRKLERADLSNARIINYDAFPVLSRMVPDDSIAEVHVYFPDPWPRPRERKRRIIRQEMLEQFSRVLRSSGIGYFVTDHGEYFQKCIPLLADFFEIEVGEVRDGEPRTNYEAKYRKEGRPIYQVMFRPRK
jgi:tRNA (guanine-N7-)-methyltransferase